MKRAELTPEYLRTVLAYEPETGEFRWKAHNRNGVMAGTVDQRGYLRITVLAHGFKAHRLAFALVTGAFPPSNLHVDHLNGDKLDNRLCNLRICTAKQNQENSRIPKHSTTRLKGVSRSGTRFRAAICHDRKQIHLGCFSSAEEAHAAYCEAAVHLGWAVHRTA